jgi:hypothetical protein
MQRKPILPSSQRGRDLASFGESSAWLATIADLPESLAYSMLDSELPDFAATTAGATTIPIKASAIKMSCMG